MAGCIACGSRRQTSRALDRLLAVDRKTTEIPADVDYWAATGMTLGVDQRTSAGAR